MIRNREKFVFSVSYHIYIAEKTISIPFDYNNFLRSRSVTWLFSLKKATKYYIFNSLTAIIIILFEFITKGNDPLPPVGIIVAFGLLIYALLKWNELYSRRKKFFDQTYLFGARYKEESMDCKYFLSDEFITYEDKEKFYRLNWSIFNPYVIFKDTILLSGKDIEGVMFTLSKKELGETDYREVCNILDAKIGIA
ncbi:MAG: hypothetical protein JO080_04895 [Mucilaginibacter sp.]|nr:hypothetical protein [Mucilaginibacter sp.]